MNEEPRDKRTNAYKQWKKNYDKENSIGLGDVVAAVTEATGIKKALKKLFDDCGCEENREKWNKVLKLKFNQQRCFTEDLFNQWTVFLARPQKHKVTHQDQLLIIKVTEHLFARSFNPCHRCGAELEHRISEINKIYDKY